MNRAASGRNVAWALGSERSPGIPGPGGLQGYAPILPASANRTPAIVESPEVNPSGFRLPGQPGAVEIGIEWSIPFGALSLLPYWHHLIGSVVIDQPEPGVNRYTFEPPLDLSTFQATSFYGLMGREPVERYFFYGADFSVLDVEIGSNEITTAKLSGSGLQTTNLSPPVAGAGNAGSYGLGPWLRGPIADEDAGTAVEVQVTRDDAGGGLQWAVWHGDGVADFTGSPPVDVAYRDGEAVWQDVQDQSGFDIGHYDTSNKDPLQIVWPGGPADHAGAAIGDTWRFERVWPLPALSLLPPGQKFTSAHWSLGTRAAGTGDPFDARTVTTGSVKLENPFEPQPGNGTRYMVRNDRQGPLGGTVGAKRTFTTTKDFVQPLEANRLIEMFLAFEGRQLGSGQFRESVRLEAPQAQVTKADRPVADGLIEEDIEISLVSNESGTSAPIRIVVITDQVWAPPA